MGEFAPCPLGESSSFQHACCTHLETLAVQWRTYYDVPIPFPRGGPPERQELLRHLLPQPTRPNTHFEQPVFLITSPCCEPVGVVLLFDIHKETQPRVSHCLRPRLRIDIRRHRHLPLHLHLSHRRSLYLPTTRTKGIKKCTDSYSTPHAL